ncbi:1-acyl-sn-glycerol-3-phosphate acyltransferase epsilon-like [Mizuhopecten yessoensis]|uniref:1-acyl-sn-glycerol-3-phosphate acyltransferase epsilon-like n=1 Tax=Mizuhopecten yessoensis TaxID=6573 RepID=UPI000B45C942|nr:1-acyl-sn-glycerol-3-phosphate acyltransferase epsilon-like [Mizuhopecten yessoensis]XP_021375348.1 1-acyl-sn-glycerol-3-phosphate acyltransferase epsilon-like [Mizuhopecten yessoensis]
MDKGNRGHWTKITGYALTLINNFILMLSIIVHLHSIRWAIPAVVMVGSAPFFLGLWGGIRLVTSILPRKCYRTGDDYLYTIYQRMVIFFFYHVSGVELLAYGDTDLLKKKENAIFICNHQNTVDWAVANFLAVKQGSLGHLRYILKDGLKFLPFFGPYFKQHGCIYIKRGGKFDQEKLKRDVAVIKDKKEPIWLVIFPEGTRYNPEIPKVLERSRAFAREKGLKELTNVLSPRTKALHACIEQLAGHVDVVYDITIAYSNTKDSSGQRIPAPPMTDFLLGKVSKLHLNLERIAMQDIPKEEERLQTWLHRLYERKDKIMTDFYSDDVSLPNAGKFPGDAQQITFKHRQTLPCLLFFTTCIGLILSTPEGRIAYGKFCVFGALGGWVWMAFRS